jgi:hypothetical protein
MKIKITFFVFFLILGISISDAQFIHTYGLKAGYVKAEMRSTYAPQTGLDASWISPIEGFDAGVFVECFDLPCFSLLAEAHYIQKGRTWTLKASALANNEHGYIDLGLQETKERVSYISFPVLAKLRIEGSTVTPFLTAGSSFEYAISFPASNFFTSFNKAEVDFICSAGLEISFGAAAKVSIECRYSQSLTNAYKNEFVTVDNQALEILLGLHFDEYF